MTVQPSQLQDLLEKADGPAEKAALIAEATLSNLPPPVALVARRAVILHWFNQDIIAALLPAEAEEDPETVYRQLAGLSFMETVPCGLAYHDLTRTGLLYRLSHQQSNNLLKETPALAAPVYAGNADQTVALEGLYCYILAGATDQALELLDKLIYWAVAREDWSMLSSIFARRDEAESYYWVQPYWGQPLPRSALHHFASGLAHFYPALTRLATDVADINRVIELNPNDAAAAYIDLGNVYVDRPRFDAAVADFSRAIELQPDYAIAYIGRGKVHAVLGRGGAAMADFNRAIKLQPDVSFNDVLLRPAPTLAVA